MRTPSRKYLSVLFTLALTLSACSSPQTKPYDTSNSLVDGGQDLNVLQQIVGESVETVEDALIRGDQASREGKDDLALLFYVKAVDMDPARLDALRRLATAYERRDEHSRAAVTYGLILRASPTDGAAHEKLGSFLLKNREYGAARTHFEQALEGDPGRWAAHNALGIISDLESDYDAAVAHYEAALQKRPSSPDILNNLGYSYYLAGDAEMARKYFSRAIAADPNNSHAIQNVAFLEARSGNYDLALRLFSRVMDRAAALNNVGYVCMLEENYGEAIRFFEIAIDESPSYYPLAVENLNRARELHAQRKF